MLALVRLGFILTWEAFVYAASDSFSVSDKVVHERLLLIEKTEITFNSQFPQENVNFFLFLFFFKKSGMVSLLTMIWNSYLCSLGDHGMLLRGAWNSGQQKQKDLTTLKKNSKTNLCACCLGGKKKVVGQQLTRSCTRPYVIHLLIAKIQQNIFAMRESSDPSEKNQRLLSCEPAHG